MRNTVQIVGVPVDNVMMGEALDIIKKFLEEDRIHTVYTPNAEIMMAAHRDETIKNILAKADLLLPDGAGVVLASKILGTPLKERVAGFDLTMNSFQINIGRKIRYFLFGGKPGVALDASEYIKSNFPNVEIVGVRDGYCKPEDLDGMIEEINATDADILLVALGAPRQEKWIHENRHKLKVKVCIGVGGTFDILSGNSQRAPEFFQKNGLEWLYRLYKEPWRYKRMMDLPRFILLITGIRIRNMMKI